MPRVRFELSINQKKAKSDDMNTGLEILELCKAYDERPVVNGVSMSVKPGEVVGLLGPNGAGKTTAFYMIIGLVRPDKGKVFFSGHEITNMPMHERSRLGLGYLAQEPSVFSDLTVEENIITVLEAMDLEHKEQKRRLPHLLEELGLREHAKKKAHSLSGGQRRRLEITRALATEPKCLMLDEPFANIDPLAIQDLKAMIMLLKKKGIAVLITDHNARELFTIVDRSYLMADGKVLLSGSVSELTSNQQAKEKYFGDSFEM